MDISFKFLTAMVDTLTEHIAVIDRQGKIIFVNKSWCLFSQDNGYKQPDQWIGNNYLSACKPAAAGEADIGSEAAQGIISVISGEKASYYLEYPCDSPSQKRWFLMRAVPFQLEDETFVVISHSNITERKLAEEQVIHLSRIDSLTGLANRRFFDEWYKKSWARCCRDHSPLTIALIDIDHFKLLNDHLGHSAGDDCLQAISDVLLSFVRRPDDIAVRFGGDELMLGYCNTSLEQSLALLKEFKSTISDLKIPNPKAPTGPTITLSIGISSAYPSIDDDPDLLIRHADELLYAAKQNGRNNLKYENAYQHSIAGT
jgi:diguanylate cyclase (GGDEF)-like protein/PAS domain S-box-containing protein